MERGKLGRESIARAWTLEMREEKSTEDILNRRAKKREGHGLGKGRGDLKKSCIAERRVESCKELALLERGEKKSSRIVSRNGEK